MIELKSDILRVQKILKTTKAKFFRDLEIGDIIILSVLIKNPGHGSRRRLYATYITVTNLNTKNTTQCSLSQIIDRLDCFDLAALPVCINKNDKTSLPKRI